MTWNPGAALTWLVFATLVAHPAHAAMDPRAVTVKKGVGEQLVWSGDLIAVESDDKVAVFTPELKKVATHPFVPAREHRSGMCGAMDLRDGRLLVAASGQLTVLDARSGKKQFQLNKKPRKDEIVGGVFSSDGQSWLATQGGERVLFSHGTRTVLGPAARRGGPCFTRDEAGMAEGHIWWTSGKEVSIWKEDALDAPRVVQLQDGAWRTRQGGGRLLVVTASDAVWIDLATGAVTVAQVPGLTWAPFEVTRDGRAVVYSVSQPEQSAAIVVWDVATARQVARIEAERVFTLSLSPDESRVAWVAGNISVAPLSALPGTPAAP